MESIDLTRSGEIAVLTMQRGKVHAMNEASVAELTSRIEELAEDRSTRALVLTGRGVFFSFGLDVPELYPLSRERFTRFLESFTALYTALYAFSKPIVAAVNGHAIAGGCMMAIACDRRIMARGPGRISLNEITFGSTVFAGSVEMLRSRVGQANAEEILFSGTMYQPEEALRLGLVDRLVASDDLGDVAIEEARRLGARDPIAFASMKRLLRDPILETMRLREAASIRRFVEIWYSESTREQLRKIEIRK